jgi:hypothetical protein
MGFEIVFGLAFFVEVAAVDAVYYSNREVLYFQTTKSFSASSVCQDRVLLILDRLSIIRGNLNRL